MGFVPTFCPTAAKRRKLEHPSGSTSAESEKVTDNSQTAVRKLVEMMPSKFNIVSSDFSQSKGGDMFLNTCQDSSFLEHVFVHLIFVHLK